jgi:HEAT repeat protein
MIKPHTFFAPAALVLALAVCAPQGWCAAAPPPAPTLSPAATDEALAKLASTDWIIQAEGMSVLADARVKQAVPALRAILAGNGHPWSRGRALVALAGILGEAEADEALLAADQPAPEVRAAAMEALAVTGSPRALAVVQAHLEDKAPAVAQEAFVALARLQKEKSWPRIAPLLTSGDIATVRRAAPALVYVGTPQAHKELLGLLGHKDEGVRLAAAHALQEVRDPGAIPALLAAMSGDGAVDVKAACERALLAYEPQALAPPLLAALQAPQGTSYQEALKILAARPSPEARAGVVAFLQDTPKRAEGVRGAALEVAAGADPQANLELFVRYLENAEPTLRRKAVEILGRCEGADLFTLLKPRLADANKDVRYVTLRVLRRATKQAPAGGIVDYVDGIVKDPVREVFDEAMGLLAERLTAPEVPKAVVALDPVLGGADDQRRGRAAAILEPLASDDLCRRLAAAQGFLVEWKVIGPFPNDDRRGITAVYPPELGLDFMKTCEPYRFGGGAMFKTPGARSVAGGSREILAMRPPLTTSAVGRTVATYSVDLPQAKGLKFTAYVAGQNEGEHGDGVRLAVDAGAKRLLDQKLPVSQEFQPVEASLAEQAGKRVVLDLVVEGAANAKGDWAALAEPRIVSDDGLVADLVKLAPTAAVRTVAPGDPAVKLAWDSVKAARAAGVVDFREVLGAGDRQTAYAAAELESAADRKVWLTIVADDASKVWLNGAMLAEKRSAGTARLEADLKKGRNLLLLKVCNESDKFFCSVRVSEKDGRRAEGLKTVK